MRPSRLLAPGPGENEKAYHTLRWNEPGETSRGSPEVLRNQDKVKSCVGRLSHNKILTFHCTILFRLFADKNNNISVTFVFGTTAMIKSLGVAETLSLPVAY